MPKLYSASKRFFSLLTLSLFLFTNHFGQNTFVYAAAAAPLAAAIEIKNSPLEVGTIQMPAVMGKIEESFRGTGNETVIVIQDAHSIPDAQKNIQRIINHFQKQYGVRRVGLEGASSRLDPQIFKSFPDKKILRQIFSQYLNQGELTAGTGAAIFSEGELAGTEFQGVEDWDLYEEGIGLYLAAIQQEETLAGKLQAWSSSLTEQKEKNYPEALIALDKKLEAFRRNEADLVETLKALSSVQMPEPGSDLFAFLQELKNERKDQSAVEMEVTRISRLVEKYLKDKKPAEEGKKDLQSYYAKKQEFQISKISAQAFALFLKELIAKDNLKIKVSVDLLGGIENQKKMRDIEGTRFFRDLEAYEKRVKSSLMTTAAQRALDSETEALGIAEKMMKLELSREEWARFSEKAVIGTGEFVRAEDFALHEAFYKNAEARDAAFLKNLEKGFGKESKSAVLVAGGFHAQGLTRRLKAQNTSYLLIMPEIQSIPKDTRYQEQMRDEVSWKSYFKAENGKIDLYKAFVRATRDRLLQADESKGMLKEWRDQIVRDLADKKQIQKAGEYTQFLDEVLEGGRNTSSTPDLQSSLLEKALGKVEKFVAGLRGLKERDELTEVNIMNLVKPGATIPRATAAQMVPRSRGNSESALIRSAASAVSRTRQVRAISEKTGKTVRAENRTLDRRSFLRAAIVAGLTVSSSTMGLRDDVRVAPQNRVVRSGPENYRDVAKRLLDKSAITKAEYEALQIETGMQPEVSYEEFQKERFSERVLEKVTAALELIARIQPEIYKTIQTQARHLVVADVAYPAMANVPTGTLILGKQTWENGISDLASLAVAISHESDHLSPGALQDNFEEEIRVRVNAVPLFLEVFGEKHSATLNLQWEIEQAEAALDLNLKPWDSFFVKSWITGELGQDPGLPFSQEPGAAENETISIGHGYELMRKASMMMRGQANRPVVLMGIGVSGERSEYMAMDFAAGNEKGSIHLDADGKVIYLEWNGKEITNRFEARSAEPVLSRRTLLGGMAASAAALYFGLRPTAAVRPFSPEAARDNLRVMAKDSFQYLLEATPLSKDSDFQNLFSRGSAVVPIQNALAQLEIQPAGEGVLKGSSGWEKNGKIFLSQEYLGVKEKQLRAKGGFTHENWGLSLRDLSSRVAAYEQQNWQGYEGSQEEAALNDFYFPLLELIAHELFHVYQEERSQLTDYTGKVEDNMSGLRELEAYRFQKKVGAGIGAALGLFKEIPQEGLTRGFFKAQNASHLAGEFEKRLEAVKFFFDRALIPASSTRDLNRNAAEALFILISMLHSMPGMFDFLSQTEEGQRTVQALNDKIVQITTPQISGRLDDSLKKAFDVLRSSLGSSAAEILSELTDKSGLIQRDAQSGELDVTAFEKYLSTRSETRSENREEEIIAAEAGLEEARRLAAAGNTQGAEAKLLSIFEDSESQYGSRKSFTDESGIAVRAELEDLFHMVELTIAEGRASLNDEDAPGMHSTPYFNLITHDPEILPFFRQNHQELLKLGKYIDAYIYALGELQDFNDGMRGRPPALRPETSFLAKSEFLSAVLRLTGRIKDVTREENGGLQTEWFIRKFLQMAGTQRGSGAGFADTEAISFVLEHQDTLVELDPIVLGHYLNSLGEYADNYLNLDLYDGASVNRGRPESEHLRNYKNPFADIRVLTRAAEISRSAENKAEAASNYFGLMSQHAQLVIEPALRAVSDFLRTRAGLELNLLASQQTVFFEKMMEAARSAPGLRQRDFSTLLGQQLAPEILEELAALINALIPGVQIQTAVDVLEVPENRERWDQLSKDQQNAILKYAVTDSRKSMASLNDFSLLLSPEVFLLYQRHGESLFPFLRFLRNAPQAELNWLLENGSSFFDLSSQLSFETAYAYGEALLRASQEDRETLKSREFLERIVALSGEFEQNRQRDKPFKAIFSFIQTRGHAAYLSPQQVLFGSTASDFMAISSGVWSEYQLMRQNGTPEELAFWNHPGVMAVVAALTGRNEFSAFKEKLKNEEFKQLVLTNEAARNFLIESLKGPVRESQTTYLKTVTLAVLQNPETGNFQARLQSEITDEALRDQLLGAATRNARFQEYLSADNYAGLRFLNQLAASRGLDMAMGYANIISFMKSADDLKRIQIQYQDEFFSGTNPQTFLLAVLTIVAHQPSLIGQIDLARQRRNHDAWEGVFDTYARAASDRPEILGDEAFEQEINDILAQPAQAGEVKPRRGFSGYARRNQGALLFAKEAYQRNANRWQVAENIIRMKQRKEEVYQQYLRNKEAVKRIHPEILEEIHYYPVNISLHPEFFEIASRFNDPSLFQMILHKVWRGSRPYSEVGSYDVSALMNVLKRFSSEEVTPKRVAEVEKWMTANTEGQPDERLAAMTAFIDLDVSDTTLKDLLSIKAPAGFYARLNSTSFQNSLRRLKSGFGAAVVDALIRVVINQGAQTNFDLYENDQFYTHLERNVDTLYGEGGRQIFGAVASEASFALLGLPTEELSQVVQALRNWAGSGLFQAELSAGNFIVLQQWYSVYTRLKSQGLAEAFQEHLNRAPPQLKRNEYLTVLSSLHDDLLFHLVKLPGETAAAWQNNLAVLQELNSTHAGFKASHYVQKKLSNPTLRNFSVRLTKAAALLNYRTPELSGLNPSDFSSYQFESLEKALEFAKALSGLTITQEETAKEIKALREEIQLQILARAFFQRILDTGRRSLVPEMRSFTEQINKHLDVMTPAVLNQFLEHLLKQKEAKFKDLIKLFHFSGDLLQIRAAIKSKLEDAVTPAETAEGNDLASTRKFLGRKAFDILDDEEMTVGSARAIHRAAIMKLFTNLTGVAEIPDATLDLFGKDAALFSKILTIVSLYYSLENHTSGGSHGDRENMRKQISAMLREFVLTRDHGKLRDAMLKLEANRKETALLIKAGYDERLFTQGFQMDIEVKAVNEAERRETAKAAVRQASQELIELAVQSDFRPQAMTALSEGDFSAVRFDNLAAAQEFVTEMSRKASVTRAIQDRLGQILTIIQKIEEDAVQKSQGAAAEKVRIVMSKDVIDEMTSCTNVPGCFSPQGIHREMPVAHSMEANAFMVRIYGVTETGAQGPMIANLVAGLTDEGVVIWGVYSNRPELNLQNGETLLEFWKSLAHWAPAVILSQKSAGWEAAVKENLTKTQNVTVTKRGTMWGPMYYDGSGESQANGSQKMSFDNAIIIKKEQFPNAPVPVPNTPAPSAAPEAPASSAETAETQSAQPQREAEAPAAGRVELTKEEKKEIQKILFELGLNLNLNPVLAQLNDIILNPSFDLDAVLSTLKSRTQRNQPAEAGDIQALKDKILELQRFYRMPELVSEGFDKLLEQIEAKREELAGLNSRRRQNEILKILKTILTEDLKVNLHPEEKLADNSALSKRLSQRGSVAVDGDAARLFEEGITRAQQLLSEGTPETAPDLEEELLGLFQPDEDQAAMTGSLLMENGSVRIELQEPGSNLHLNEASFRRQTDISRKLQFELYVKNGQVRLEIVDLVALENAPSAVRFYLMFGQFVQTLADRLGLPVIVENETAVFGGEETGLGMTQVKKPQSQIKDQWIKKIQPLGLTAEDFRTQGIDQDNFRYYEAVFNPQRERHEVRDGVDEAAFESLGANADTVAQLTPLWETVAQQILSGEARFSDEQLLKLFNLIETHRALANLYAPAGSLQADFVESMTRINPVLRAGRTPEQFAELLSRWAQNKLGAVASSGESVSLVKQRISREEFTGRNPGLAAILFDPAKAKTLYEILSVLRILTDFRTHQVNLETGRVEKVTSNRQPVEVAPNVFVRSGTGSFRRHVLSETDGLGNTRGAVEIKMPGDWTGKSQVSLSDYTVAEDLARLSPVLRERVQLGLFASQLPGIVTLNLYGKEEMEDGLQVIISEYNPDVQGRLEDYAGLTFQGQKRKRYIDGGGKIQTLIPADKVESVVDQTVLILKSIFEAGYTGNLDLVHLQNLSIEEKPKGEFFVHLPNDFAGFKTMASYYSGPSEDAQPALDPFAAEEADARIKNSILVSIGRIRLYLLNAFPEQTAMINQKFLSVDPSEPDFFSVNVPYRAENRIEPVSSVLRTLLTERRLPQQPQRREEQPQAQSQQPQAQPDSQVTIRSPSLRFQQFAVAKGLVPSEGAHVLGSLRNDVPHSTLQPRDGFFDPARDAYESLSAAKRKFVADLQAAADHSLDYVIAPAINGFVSPDSEQTLLDLIRLKLKASGDVRLIVYDDSDVNTMEGGLAVLDDYFNLAYEYDNGDALPRSTDASYFIYTLRSENRHTDVDAIASVLGGNLGRRASEILVNRVDEAFVSGTELNKALAQSGFEYLKFQDSEQIRALLQQKLSALQQAANGNPVGILTLYHQLEDNKAALTAQEKLLLRILELTIPPVPNDPDKKRLPAEKTKADVFESNLLIYAESVKESVYGFLGITYGLRAKDPKIQEDACKLCPHSTGVFNNLAGDFAKDLGKFAEVDMMESYIGDAEYHRAGDARHLWTELSDGEGQRFYVSLVDSQFPGFDFDTSPDGSRTTGKVNVFQFKTDEERDQILRKRGIVLSGIKINNGFMKKTLPGLIDLHKTISKFVQAKAIQDESGSKAVKDTVREEALKDFRSYWLTSLLMTALMISSSKVPEDQISLVLSILEDAAKYREENADDLEVDFGQVSGLLLRIFVAQNRLSPDDYPNPSLTSEGLKMLIQRLGRSEVPSPLLGVVQKLEDSEDQIVRDFERNLEIVRESEEIARRFIENPDDITLVSRFIGNSPDRLKLVTYNLNLSGYDSTRVERANAAMQNVALRAESRSEEIPSPRISKESRKDGLLHDLGAAIIEERSITLAEAREVKADYLKMGDEAFLQTLRQSVEDYYAAKAEQAGEEDRYKYEAMKQEELKLIDAMNSVPGRSNQKVTVALAGKTMAPSLESIFLSVISSAGDVGTLVPAGTDITPGFMQQLKKQGVGIRPTANASRPVKVDGQSEVPMYVIGQDSSLQVNSAFMPVTLKFREPLSGNDAVMAEQHGQRLAMITLILSARFFSDPTVKTRADLLKKLNEIPAFRNVFSTENNRLVVDATAAWLTILTAARNAKQAAGRAA